MADRSEAAKTDDRHPKKIKEVIVKYEENGQPGVMILTHESQGHFVDAIVFENHGSTHSKRLIDRLGLEDNGKFSPINIVTGTRPGHKKWKVEVVGAGVRTGHCIWVHDEDCLWSENCGPEREA